MSREQKYINDEYVPRSKRHSNGSRTSEGRKHIDYSDDETIEKSPPSKGKDGASKPPVGNSSPEIPENSTNSSTAKTKKIEHPVRRFILNILCVFFALYLIAVGTVYSVLGKVHYSEPIERWDDSIASNAPEWELASSPRVKNILLLGIDGNANKGRSDTMIILSIDRLSRQIKLTSLLRDLYVTIPGRGENRLNAAFSFGGPKLLMQTIECNFRIKIDQYICVNFTSFENIISTIGGVNITLTDAEAAYINKFVPGSLTGGVQRLNGAQAVLYARIRQIGTDFGRTSRQRTLLEALMNECKTLKLSQLINLVELISPYLDTNISRLSLAMTAVEGISCWFNKIQECSIPVKDGYSSQTIRGMSVLVPKLEQNCTVLHEFIFGRVPKNISQPY